MNVFILQIAKDKPVLRVLFHGSFAGAAASAPGSSHHHHHGSASSSASKSSSTSSLSSTFNSICIQLHASLDGNDGGRRDDEDEQLTSTCSPDSRDGTCLGEIILPNRWWPSLAPTGSGSAEKNKKSGGGKIKIPKIKVRVSYSVYETRGKGVCSSSGSEKGEKLREQRGGRANSETKILSRL